MNSFDNTKCWNGFAIRVPFPLAMLKESAFKDMVEEVDKKAKVKKALLIFSESVHNADMYYATKFLSPDPFVYLQYSGKDVLIVSQMECERARKEARVKEIRSTLEYSKNSSIKTEELIAKVLEEEDIKETVVPRYFPLYIADELRKKGIAVFTAAEVMNEREIKNEKEINYIKKAQISCEKAMELAIAVIKKSVVRDKNNMLIFWEKKMQPLTSEGIKAYVEHALIDMECTIENPIVACGKEASDPHFSGSGSIFANEPIILDFSPRLKKERYYADMTRTVVKGEPSKEIKEMYEAVKEAQSAALSCIKEGIECREVHNLVCDVFEEEGYDTIRKGGKKGFIHSTGHGIGLDLHENPTVGDNDYTLRRGNAMTIEPGLYYPDVGSVRLEDVVVVLKNGCENLTRFERKIRV